MRFFRFRASFFRFRASIVASMISVLAGFAHMQVAKARQDITRENAAVQLAAISRRAPLDSVRPYLSTAAEMAGVVEKLREL
jgi:hypothetical protein